MSHELISLCHIDIERYLEASIVPNKLSCVYVFSDCVGIVFDWYRIFFHITDALD